MNFLSLVFSLLLILVFWLSCIAVTITHSDMFGGIMFSILIIAVITIVLAIVINIIFNHLASLKQPTGG